MAAVRHRLQWEKGTRRSTSAEIELVPPGGEPLVIALEPILTFQMLGLGYTHFEWGHGMWKGEDALAGESWQLGRARPARSASHPRAAALPRAARRRGGHRLPRAARDRAARPLGLREPARRRALTGRARWDLPHGIAPRCARAAPQPPKRREEVEGGGGVGNALASPGRSPGGFDRNPKPHARRRTPPPSRRQAFDKTSVSEKSRKTRGKSRDKTLIRIAESCLVASGVSGAARVPGKAARKPRSPFRIRNPHLNAASAGASAAATASLRSATESTSATTAPISRNNARPARATASIGRTPPAIDPRMSREMHRFSSRSKLPARLETRRVAHELPLPDGIKITFRRPLWTLQA